MYFCFHFSKQKSTETAISRKQEENLVLRQKTLYFDRL